MAQQGGRKAGHGYLGAFVASVRQAMDRLVAKLPTCKLTTPETTQDFISKHATSNSQALELMECEAGVWGGAQW